MIELKNDELIFRFPEIHPDAVFSVDFQRTLRIPDDNREYSLPPGLGNFPLHHVDDFLENLPTAWGQHGGVFLPMYQAEALWINFHGDYPFAVKIAAGKIDAVTGKSWSNKLKGKRQNYLVIPDQPWLDGFCIAKGKIRQFIAMPLGEGYTAEEQLTGEAEFGGIQIMAFPMKRKVYETIRPQVMFKISESLEDATFASLDMGLVPGGVMSQEIYEDKHGIDAWETQAHSRCFVHIANSLLYGEITGGLPPTTPPTAKDYTDAGLPWFEYYDAELKALEGSSKLRWLDSVAALGAKKGQKPLPENEPVKPTKIKKISGKHSLVREGNF